jgi:hypothetical protein
MNDFEIIEDKKLVSKNMTLKDIKEQKEELKNKKIGAFTEFISYKKKDDKTKVDRPKNILDYYNTNNIHNKDNNENSNEIIFKNINFCKRK